MTTPPRLRERIDEELPRLAELRHDLHRHPELSYQERRTSGVVQRELAAMGIEFKANVAGGTGVVAHLPATGRGGASAGPQAKHAVALRADMDALPIVEQTGKPYASESAGVMHACGHDGHTTILLGAARVLSRIDDRPNPVTFIFQPAEEGGAGGEKMCDEGALRGDGAPAGLGTPVGRIYGLHGWPQLPLGTIASKPGPLLAATDDFDITVRGVQAHAAYPQLSRDPIVATAHVIMAIQTIVSRAVAPVDSAVVTVGSIQGGTANNIIPETVRFTGTLRTLRPEVRTAAKERLLSTISATAAALGCNAEITWEDGYPATHNDPAEAERVLALAADAFGRGRVIRIEHPSLGGEDFAYYGRHVPACFYMLGLRPAGVDRFPSLHQPDFDFNDAAIPTGVEMMVRLALST